MNSAGAARRTAWAAWGFAMLSIGGYIAVAVADRRVVLDDRYGFHTYRAVEALVALGFASIGVVVALRRSSNPIGWLWLIGGAAGALRLAARGYAVHGLFAHPGALPGARWAAWLENWLWVPGLVLPVIFVLLLFPDGHLPGPRWRPVYWAAVAASVGAWAGGALTVGTLEDFPTVRNPAGFDGAEPLAASTLCLPVVLAFAVAALVVRWRRGAREERQQIKLVVYAAVLFAVAFAVAMVLQPWNSPAVALLGVPFLGLCAATAVAILRYRLYDVDVLINRTLVYTALTTVVLVVSVATVSSLTFVVGGLTRLPASVAAGVVAAAVAHPARERLQRSVNRLMYGDRDDPYAVVARLSRRVADALPADTVLAGVAETVALSLRFPYAAVEALRGGEFVPTAAFGTATEARESFALHHQGVEVGRLVVGRRGDREPLSPADELLLGDLAQHIAAAVHAVALAAELQRSREDLVVTREEERRRIRRDLHDGLGPSLAAFALSAQAARNSVRTDPARAEDLLDDLQHDAQHAVADIRRLVYALRPPALDELGLVGAIREQAARLGVQVDAPDDLGPLSAAVEVAALRIAVEAMTNVHHHAAARTATLRLALNGALELDVIDDGRGLPAALRAGVGLRSMRERADELGGTCVIAPAPGGGTQVHVRLPVTAL